MSMPHFNRFLPMRCRMQYVQHQFFIPTNQELCPRATNSQQQQRKPIDARVLIAGGQTQAVRVCLSGGKEDMRRSKN